MRTVALQLAFALSLLVCAGASGQDAPNVAAPPADAAPLSPSTAPSQASASATESPAVQILRSFSDSDIKFDLAALMDTLRDKRHEGWVLAAYPDPKTSQPLIGAGFTLDLPGPRTPAARSPQHASISRAILRRPVARRRPRSRPARCDSRSVQRPACLLEKAKVPKAHSYPRAADYRRRSHAPASHLRHSGHLQRARLLPQFRPDDRLPADGPQPARLPDRVSTSPTSTSSCPSSTAGLHTRANSGHPLGPGRRRFSRNSALRQLGILAQSVQHSLYQSQWAKHYRIARHRRHRHARPRLRRQSYRGRASRRR